MAKKLFLLLLVILGSCIFPLKGEIKALAGEVPASGQTVSSTLRPHRHRSFYRIVNSRYVSRSSIRKVSNNQTGVRIHLLQNGIDNTGIENFDLAYDSGIEYRMGNTYGIDYARLPLYVKVTYTTWNTFHAVQNDVIYEFVIYAPGTWDVRIHN